MVSEVAGMLQRAGYVVEAFASALCRPPGRLMHNHPVPDQLAENAGFVCILGSRR